MTFYSRKLPHWQPDHAEFFITFRLANSLPKTAIEKIKSELIKQQINEDSSSGEGWSDKLSDLRKKYQFIFKIYEDQLDNATTGPSWLSNIAVANIVREAIHYRDDNKHSLYAYCIMPNHVHLIIKMLNQNKDGELPALTKKTPKFEVFYCFRSK